MTKKSKANSLSRLKSFILQNETADWQNLPFSGLPNHPDLNWKRLQKYKAEIVESLRIYRRLLRIVPEENQPEIIFALMEQGLHSAVQIAALPKRSFIQNYLTVFGEDESLLARVYQNAQAIRSQLLIQYLN